MEIERATPIRLSAIVIKRISSREDAKCIRVSSLWKLNRTKRCRRSRIPICAQSINRRVAVTGHVGMSRCRTAEPILATGHVGLKGASINEERAATFVQLRNFLNFSKWMVVAPCLDPAFCEQSS